MKLIYKIEIKSWDFAYDFIDSSAELKFLQEQGQDEWELIQIETKERKTHIDKKYYFKKNE